MFKKKLEFTFLTVIALSLTILINNHYKTSNFKNNPLPQSYVQQIEAKEKNILQYMQKNFGCTCRFPIIITDKIPGKLYGLTSYENGSIKIYLNKKVMQESFQYILDSVIAHEYAHALLFKLQKATDEKAGHSKEWKQTCTLLGGKDCQQYVNQKEIIISKMPFK
jgi:hypothetical protein